ncbi:Vps54-domain-containing protein, partial [Metschnikowia bicuspidata]
PDRLSIETLASINEDVTWASEASSHSRPPVSESVFSSMRQSLDGSYQGSAFNILKQLNGLEEDKILNEGSSLGPNSIYDLTTALDQARIRLKKGLKTLALINGGANKVYNLVKPTTRDIPPIQLQPLQDKILKERFLTELVNDVADDYKAFELSYKSLTMDTLSKLSQQYEECAESQKRKNSTTNLQELPHLKVPAVFESADFNLEDQRVFNQVIEGCSIFPENDSSQDLQVVHNSKVQESLSHYLDAVEQHIVEEISHTAGSFFATLGDIEEIKVDAQKCIQSFEALSASLDQMQQNQADVGLDILNLIDQYRNINHLESSVLQIDAVLKGFDVALQDYNGGRNIKCLNKLLVVKSLIKGVLPEHHPDEESLFLYPKLDYPLVDVSKLGALKNKQKSIETLMSACCRAYIDEFIHLLLEDLQLHQASVSTQDLINRMYMSTSRAPKRAATPSPSYNVISPEFRAKASVFIKDLAKAGYVIPAFSQYQDKIIREVKSIIRDRLPTSRADTPMDPLSATVDGTFNENERSNSQDPTSIAGSTSGSLTSSLKSMSDQDFLRMMRDIFASLSECLRRLTVHQKFLLDVSLSSLPPTLEINVISLDISPKINTAIEITQVRLTKLLNVRLESFGDLPLRDYLQVFLLTSGYLQECEAIDPSYNALEQGSTLNEWVKNHLTYYCHRAHSSALRRLVSSCEKELWKGLTGPQLEVTQGKLDELFSYAAFVETGKGFDGSAWVQQYLDFQELNSEVWNSTGDTSTDTLNNTLKKFQIKDKSFFVPSFMPAVVQMTTEYVIFTRIFSGRERSVAQNLLTYFRVLNSRISLAILSAGATKTAGLKHITTRHLALCLQTVEFLSEFLKCIQLIYPSSIKASQDNTNTDELSFEQVIKSYEDHEQALFAKIVSIMHDRTVNHCNSILKLNLSKPISHPQQCHPYMEVLVKETQTVANVLGKYISEAGSTLILLQIFDNYKQLLVNCFCSDLNQLKDFNEKHSLLKDIDYFRVKLGDLQGYGNSGQVIWENVNSLPTIEDARMAEVMRNNIEGER